MGEGEGEGEQERERKRESEWTFVWGSERETTIEPRKQKTERETERVCVLGGSECVLERERE